MAGEEVRFNTSEPAKAPAAPADAKGDASGVQFGAPAPKTEGASATPEPKTERPAWLPEKFKSPEDLAKAYGELEKSRATPKAPAKGSEPEPIPFETLTAEFSEKGEISEETLASMEKRGIPRTVIDGYIKGQQALAQQQRSKLAAVVDGEENLTEIMKWAEKNLDESEISGYNALIDSGNLTAASVLLKDFGARFAEKKGKDPASSTTAAGNGQVSGVGGYASTAEMIADMRLPKYQNDPAFREHVKARIAKTTAF